MHFRRCVGGPGGGYVLDVIRKPRTPKLFLECYCITRKSQSGISLPHTAVLCLVPCQAWRKSLTREPRSLFSTPLQTFSVSAHAFLHTSKYGQFWSLHKHVCVPKKLQIKIRCIKYSETNNKLNTGYPIEKRSVKQLAGFHKTLGWILSTFVGANASAASTWFGLGHARRKIVV